jgi:hypothetical protein
MKKFGGKNFRKGNFFHRLFNYHSTTIQISFKHTIVIQTKII